MINEFTVEMIDGVLVESPELNTFIERCIVEHGKDEQYHRSMLTAFVKVKMANGDATSVRLN